MVGLGHKIVPTPPNANSETVIGCNLTTIQYYENGKPKESFTKIDNIFQGTYTIYSEDGSWKILTFVKENMHCYNCRNPLTEEQNHREHIPPKNLFDGFPNAYRETRIVVPACYTCNQSFSYADEEFRNLIGIINKKPEAVKLVEKTNRSFMRLDAKLARIIYSVTNKMPYAVQFDTRVIEKFHIKNFKGLYYFNYGSPFPENFEVVAHFDKTVAPEKSQKLINYLTQNFSWKVSGHENVFRYILQPFRQGHNFDGNDIVPACNEKYFLAVMSYTKNHAALILAERLDE